MSECQYMAAPILIPLNKLKTKKMWNRDIANNEWFTILRIYIGHICANLDDFDLY